MYDILIKNGAVVDGTGAAAFAADVAVAGGRIAAVGKSLSQDAKTVIDATGLQVAPGFIDPHTHTDGDLSSATTKANLPFLMQGVTTVITHNDGSSPVDLVPELRHRRRTRQIL